MNDCRSFNWGGPADKPYHLYRVSRQGYYVWAHEANNHSSRVQTFSWVITLLRDGEVEANGEGHKEMNETLRRLNKAAAEATAEAIRCGRIKTQ